LKSLSKSGEWIQIGEVIGAHGIKGGVKVYSYAESDEFFSPGRQIAIDSATGRDAFKIVRAQPHKKIVRVILENVETRDQAEALTGSGVWIPRAELPDLEEDTYYWADLIGLQAYSVAGRHLGEITGIIPTGANDVYVIQPPDGNGSDEILVPAIASVVREIDMARGRMTMDLPEGLVQGG
jgi:16S rRNA processing protein RimM